MSYPLAQAVLNIRSRYVAAFPLWSGMDVSTPELTAIAEDRARQWTLRLIGQIVYELVGQGYGSKRGDAGRPISKDGVAQVINGRLIVWDMLSGAGTGSPSLTANPDGLDITGQLFVPVEPLNVLGGVTAPPVVPPTPAGGKPYNEQYSIEFGLGCNDIYRQTGAAFDPGMIAVHASRAAFDYYAGGLDWPTSYHKHINEFRKEYGLGPV